MHILENTFLICILKAVYILYACIITPTKRLQCMAFMHTSTAVCKVTMHIPFLWL